MRRLRVLSLRQFLSSGSGAVLPLACALLLLGAAVEWHGDAAAHLPVPAAAEAGDGTVYACADGHGSRSHAERAHAVEREHCAACLHRSQRHAHAAAGPAVAERNGVAGPLAPTRGAPALPPVLDRAPSRGPPAA